MAGFAQVSEFFAAGPLGFSLAVAAGLVLAWLAHALLHAALTRLTKRDFIPRRVFAETRPATRWLLPMMAVRMALPLLGDGSRHAAIAADVLEIAIVMLASWTLVLAVRGLELGLQSRYPVDVADNLHARRVQTQARVLARSVQTLIWIFGVAVALMTLPGVRQIGASLLASAGVAGVVLGFAARPVLGNLIAGIQLALTQPIRIGDVVIVQGEYGRIEEIGASFVCVRLWDDRRQIVPLTWFIENPFENWTRTSSALLGTVTWWLDFSVPVDALRREVERLCDADPRWDRRACSTVVIDTSERAMQLRAVVSAEDSGKLFDLRCAVREGVIEFLRQRYPQALPRVRSEMRVDGDVRGDANAVVAATYVEPPSAD